MNLCVVWNSAEPKQDKKKTKKKKTENKTKLNDCSNNWLDITFDLIPILI